MEGCSISDLVGDRGWRFGASGMEKAERGYKDVKTGQRIRELHPSSRLGERTGEKKPLVRGRNTASGRGAVE